MGRFSVETSINNFGQPSMQGGCPVPNHQAPQQQIQWPAVFPKDMIAIDRNGVIVDDSNPIMSPNDLNIIPGSLDAIRTMRLKGYKVFLFFNEPLIGEGKLTPQDVDSTNQRLMEIFGQAGIMSIDGLLYSTTNNKHDMFALPNDGMIKRAESDMKLSFKNGYFVGSKLYDLKAGDKVNMKPVLIKSHVYDETIKKLDTFANKDLKNKTKTYNDLLEFANTLP